MFSNLDSTIQPVKTWYSALNNTLQPNNASGNRIGPNKRLSLSPSLKTTNSSPSITHIFKRLARSQSILKTSGSNTSSVNTPSWLSIKKRGQQAGGNEGVKIYMKSPHVVANGELSGTVVIQSEDILLLEELELSFIGIEAVIDPQSSGVAHQYQFLTLRIFRINSQQEIQSHTIVSENMICIPFAVTLAPHLSGTYKDKKCFVQYCLQSDIKSNGQDVITTKKQVLVYPNVASLKSLKDAIDLYVPIIENDKQVWKSLTSSVAMDLSLSRIVWMSGAPIYVTVKINNSTTYTICDMKLELLRKQNTYSASEGEMLIPLTSCCEIVSHTSLSTLGWWQPLKPNTKDHVVMTVEAPPNQVTIRNQKLIDVSFSIRMLISSPQRTDVVSEIPVMLVHPIALDPPPLLLAKPSTIESTLILSDPNIRKSFAKVSTSSSSCTDSLTSILSSTKPISISSISNHRHISPVSNTLSEPKALEKMKNSISSWGTILSRKLSSTRINAFQNDRPTRPDISSPMIASQLTSHDSVASSIYSSPSSSGSKTGDPSNKTYREEQRSVMKFGQIKAPKRFGQQPGCLGDAGLDIRNCFNVATANEAIQSYAAEKVEIPDDIAFYSSSSDDESDEENIPLAKNYLDNLLSYLEPIEELELKKGMMAPNEKCQVENSMLENHYEQGNHTKRMLASSRHMLRTQKNNANSLKRETPVPLPPSSVL
ncbi:hypothetical protein INT47_010032 [Mucor saturninus]|uniref:Arrestin C-terminal-like domain-containing protein n=1 Tax=Mucor saturninus TaxID=64648 RepID=A0A8H7QNZ1_9FUNG|nr:hypothetical protein INT47_010032 [Mucor saturninus]